MATKTVVCPECGAPAAPGRFACADCGALLAAVGPKPVRRRRTSPARTSAARDPDRAGTRAEGVAAAAAASPDPVSIAAPAPAPVPAPEAVPAPPPAGPPTGAPAPAPALAPRGFAIDLDEADDREIDEDAPLAAAAAEPEWPGTPVAPAWLSSVAVADPAPELVGPADDEPADQDRQPPVAPPASAWPPAGVAAPLDPPAPRTPAGAYLAPSAVLPPLDAPASRTGHHPATETATAADAKTQASLAETLDAFGITADTPRRLIGGGAAIAGLGFLLPWAEVVIGSGLAGSYWARWGLAGPGHWIIVSLLVGLVIVALAKDRLARVPVGPMAIGLGMLLVGLVWPYLFGVIGHSVGVWLVLVGAIVLGAGGILDLRRHATASPGV